MAGRLIILVVLAAAAYWYWSGPYQQGRPSGEAAQLEENARLMASCMRRESSMGAAAGMAGVGGIADDGEQLCADKYGLHFEDGQWRSNTGAGDGG